MFDDCFGKFVGGGRFETSLGMDWLNGWTGSGVFESGTDTLVATVMPLALTAGVQTVAFTDGDANVQVAYGTPRTYFVVVDRVDALPGSPTADRFTVTHITEASSTGEDRPHPHRHALAGICRRRCPAAAVINHSQTPRHLASDGELLRTRSHAFAKSPPSWFVATVD